MAALDNLTPVFNQNVKVMLAAMRLSDVDTISDDGWAIIKQGIAYARQQLYRRLGKTRIDEILQTDEVAAPTTTEELDRQLAGMVEVWMTKWRLLQDIPVLFRDKSSESLQQWNDEALVREAGASELQQLLDRLAAQIEDALAELDEDEDTQAGGTGALFSPDEDKIIPEPGGSVFNRPQNAWLRPRPTFPFKKGCC